MAGTGPFSPLAWRLLRDDPLPGARNMALDHALAAALGEGEAVLRLYGWEHPTVSLGRNEPARALYCTPADDRTWMGEPVHFVRRPTGGRAVVHWRELTYAVVAPLDAWGGLRAAYVAINEALAGALQRLGAAVSVVGASPEGMATGAGADAAARQERALRPDAGPCFRAPAPGEVTAAGRKLVGSAQARLGGALLQHGSILLEDDQGLLGKLGAGRGNESPIRRAAAADEHPATLRELLGDMSIDELARQVAMSLRETFGGEWASEGYRPSEIAAAERLEAERYANDSWTWRR